jgi:hypothetical protein
VNFRTKLLYQGNADNIGNILVIRKISPALWLHFPPIRRINGQLFRGCLHHNRNDKGPYEETVNYEFHLLITPFSTELLPLLRALASYGR